MSKFEKHTIFILMLLFANLALVKAQLPLNDPAWLLQTEAEGSEDFNQALDTNSRWYPRFPWMTNYSQLSSADITRNTNLLRGAGDTTLIIKADSLAEGDWVFVDPAPDGFAQHPHEGIHVCYTGGIIWRKQIWNGSAWVDPYDFGYIEISAKYPSGYWPLWPAFWMFGQISCGSPMPPIVYDNEIDITENWSTVSANGQQTGTNIHMGNGECDATIHGAVEINTGFTLSSGFHKYACEWAPDRIIWYIDDAEVRTLYDPTGVSIPQYPMTVILNFAIAANDAWLPDDWNGDDVTPHGNETPTGWSLNSYGQPQNFEIAYLKYYKLEPDCSADLTLSSTSYDRKVKKTIKTSASSTLNFNPSSPSASYTLRATDAVTIDTPTGSNSVTINPSSTGYFAIQVLDCPEMP